MYHFRIQALIHVVQKHFGDISQYVQEALGYLDQNTIAYFQIHSSSLITYRPTFASWCYETVPAESQKGYNLAFHFRFAEKAQGRVSISGPPKMRSQERNTDNFQMSVKCQVEFYISVELNLLRRTTAAALTRLSLCMFQDLVARTRCLRDGPVSCLNIQLFYSARWCFSFKL